MNHTRRPQATITEAVNRPVDRSGIGADDEPAFADRIVHVRAPLLTLSVAKVADHATIAVVAAQTVLEKLTLGTLLSPADAETLLGASNVANQLADKLAEAVQLAAGLTVGA